MQKSTDTKSKSQSTLKLLFSRQFLMQLGLAIVFFIVLIYLTLLALRIYTHHGQKIELNDFVGKPISEAEKLADKSDFEIIVNDSVFIVGKPGGLITDQNPKAGSLVKEGRKIYVTITKFDSEKIRVADLPVLYGNAFEQKKTELAYRDIDAEIKSYSYDPGEPNHILEVWYKGELIISGTERKDQILINKGDALQFVLSERQGGEVVVPDLRCQELEAARFLLETRKLELGDVIFKEEISETDFIYVISQNPPYDGITSITMGQKVSVTVAKTKPVDCNL
ncbi:MAG: PASTA domain-containing protein [Saprospiraceae bacterium]|nr:PASTA domain-containing protein [Saprospiraceae bacterium]